MNAEQKCGLYEDSVANRKNTFVIAKQKKKPTENNCGGQL